MRINITILAAAFLFFVSLVDTKSAGIAAFKDQPFHADSMAKPIVYAAILESAPVDLRLDLGGKVKLFDRSKIVATVEIPELPKNIRDESELAFVRKSLGEIKSFATRFTNCGPLLQPYVEGFSKIIGRFENGEIRYAGAWIPKEKYAIILKQQSQVADMESRRDMERAEQMRIQKEEAEEFAKNQRKKGLELYRNKWLPQNEVLALQKEDQEESTAWEKVRSKSVLTAVYSVFQVLDEGMLIRPRRGQLENGGINVNLAYLSDALEGSAADGDYYKGDLYWYGNYSYKTKGGSDSTINAYCLNKADAVRRVRNMLYGNEKPKSDRIVVVNKENNSSSSLPKPLKDAKASGSGFFVGNEGYFVTNAHVVKDSTAVIVYYSGKMLDAEVIKVSKVADLAILKVAQKVVGIEISADEPQPGNDIFAIGYPQPSIQGLEVKITKGVISSSKGLDDDDTRFQIDAAVQPGNSGGPLCDSSGRLVGVVVAGLNQIVVAKVTGSIPQNVNYGIKANEVSALLRTKSIDTSVLVESEKISGSQASAIKIASDRTGLVIVK